MLMTLTIDEWITMRIEFHGRRAALYLNDQRNPSFIVNEMKGESESGSTRSSSFSCSAPAAARP
jgi:hypothetical protein